jgi:maleylpyruvate isomerase
MVVSADPRPTDIAEQIEQVNEATRRLLAGLDGLTEADGARPSLCPGWTVGHVLTHIARNADGLRRGAEGARRDEAVPMYASAEARDHEIEAGAGRPMTDLVADVTWSADGLSEAWSAMSTADWDRAMLHHRYGTLPLNHTPTMRLSEVEIHHVDLGGRFGPDGWPDPFVVHILSGADGLTDRLPNGLTLQVHATDSGEHWSAGAAGGVGGAGAEGGADAESDGAEGGGAEGGAGTGGSDGPRTIVVAGPSWAIAAWLIGRPGPVADALSVTGGELPPLKPWR